MAEGIALSHILWLASYPKSGNTWLRAFLANFIADRTRPVSINELDTFVSGDMDAGPYERLLGRPVHALSIEEIYAARPRVHRLLAQQKPGAVLVKTHNRLGRFDAIPTITPDVTYAAIYVVRNPLDVVVSFADHYGVTLDDAIEASGAEHHMIGGGGRVIPQDLGSWSGHVRSWTEAPGLDRLVLRYEDMLSNPAKAFGSVVAYLQIPSNRPRLKKALRFASFRELAGQEREHGFTEKSANALRFFRQGRAGGWRSVLTPDQVKRVIDLHGPVMAAHGYADQTGRAVA